jgi:hypothetical protein
MSARALQELLCRHRTLALVLLSLLPKARFLFTIVVLFLCLWHTATKTLYARIRYAALYRPLP